LRRFSSICAPEKWNKICDHFLPSKTPAEIESRFAELEQEKINPKTGKKSKKIWTADDKVILRDAVQKHGKQWGFIVKTYFPGRFELTRKSALR
jgi:hypothetical protein